MSDSPEIRHDMMGPLVGMPLSMKCGGQEHCPIRGTIPSNTPYFVDLLSRKSYCERCGVRLRFHRKRAEQRGEAPPATIQEFEERFNAALAAAQPKE